MSESGPLNAIMQLVNCRLTLRAEVEMLGTGEFKENTS